MSNSGPLVSILINNYNKEKFCVKAVSSVLKQNYKKIEIIFFDDGSTDSSVKRINKIRKTNKNKIKIIINKTRENIFSINQLNAIKKSLKACKGKFVCILDSDDFFEKDKIKKIVKFFKENRSSEIVFDLPTIFYNSSKKQKIENEYFYRENKWPKFPPTSCLSFKKDSLIKSIKKISFEDYSELWFDFRIATFYALKKRQFNLINENLTFYRQNSNNYENKYQKFLNREWWGRRYQAFQFLKKIDYKKFNNNIFTFDYLTTLFFNKIFMIK